MSIRHVESQGNDDNLHIARNLNLKAPHVANRTKVVRLIVCPPGFAWKDRAVVRDLASRRFATRADVFIVNDGRKWVPMSWNGGALIDHRLAHKAHPESIVLVMVADREQIQWESDVPFRIRTIKPRKRGWHHGYFSKGVMKHHPFRSDLIGAAGGPCRPVVTGPATLNESLYDQMFKVSFDMLLPGENVWKIVDPDIHCDWN